MISKKRKLIFKQIIAATSGTMLQWYDFSLFGFLTPILATLYFPQGNQTASTLYTFSIFAVSFLLAPIGSAFFGYIGDNYGRKKALTLSVLAMAIPTALIGITPTYHQIGIAAPIILTILRVCQGFVASAEFSGSAVFLVEHAGQGRSYLFGSLTSSSYSMGLIIGSVLSAIATMSFMPYFTWRITFLFALAAGVLIFYMRRNILETPEFQKNSQYDQKTNASFLTAVQFSLRSVIATVLMAWFVGIITFGTYVFSATYLTQYCHLDLSTAIFIISCSLLLDASLEPLIAVFADKYGGKKILVTGMLGFILFSYPLFKLLSSTSTWVIFFAMLCMSCLIAITCAPINTMLIRLFPSSYRSSGFGFSFNLGIAIFGGTTPLILTWLISQTKNIYIPAAYYIAGAIIGLFSFILICSIKRHSSSHVTTYQSYYLNDLKVT